MSFNVSRELIAFRAEVADFLQQMVPAPLARKFRNGSTLTKADMLKWHTLLNDRGWLANHWPREYGGADWSKEQKSIFQDEIAHAGVPRVMPFMFGVDMLAPVLIKYGSETHKSRWLPRILDGSDWWCQGFSEPGAGSDLASLKTTARREAFQDGDYYVVNGQKAWTSYGHYANMMFCLARTENTQRPQEGISLLLIDLSTPGIEMRPVITLDGEHFVNEVFFTDVRVPVENLVGEENKGWTYAKYLLTYERTNIAGIGYSAAALTQLKHMASIRQRNGQPLTESPLFAARLAKVEIALENMRTTNMRLLKQADNSSGVGVESSMLKIKGSQIRQEIDDLMRRAVGPCAQAHIEGALDDHYHGIRVCPNESTAASLNYFQNRKLSILGGANEIQKNIIAKTVLGL